MADLTEKELDELNAALMAHWEESGLSFADFLQKVLASGTSLISETQVERALDGAEQPIAKTGIDSEVDEHAAGPSFEVPEFATRDIIEKSLEMELRGLAKMPDQHPSASVIITLMDKVGLKLNQAVFSYNELLHSDFLASEIKEKSGQYKKVRIDDFHTALFAAINERVANLSLKYSTDYIETIYGEIRTISLEAIDKLKFLEPSDYFYYDIAGLNSIETIFKRDLDQILEKVERHPNLHALFMEHSLAQLGTIPSKSSIDDKAILKEITDRVKVKWADRNKPEYAGEPWTKKSILFLRHWYEPWIRTGSLSQKALREYDKSLCAAYEKHIERHPEDDVGLIKETKEGYKRGQVATNPPPQNQYIPVSQLTPEQKEQRRAQEAEKKRRQRAKKSP